MNDSIFLLFCTTVILLTLSPGPDIIYVFTQSVNKGYKYGIIISAGLVTGLFIYTIASSLGISWILDKFPYLTTLIKLGGGIYIGLLAFKEFPGKEKQFINYLNSSGPFTTGLIMNLSNPKIILFFISLFPQFIFHDKLSIKYQFLILGIVFILIAFLIFSLISIFSDYLIRQSFSKINSKYFSYIPSFTLGIISLLIFISEIKYFIK